jgi:hypothetical protein
MQTILKIVTISFILLASCSEDVKPTPLEYNKIFSGKTKKTWKVASLKWKGDGKDDISYNLGSCDKDNLYTFYANAENLYEVSNGATK